MEFGDLTVEVAGGEPLTEQLHAVHLGLDAAASVVAGPPAPERPAEPLDRAQSFVAARCPGAIPLPRLGVAPGRDNGFCPTVRDGVPAGAAVVGSIGCHGRDRLIRGDLRQQAGQHRRDAHAAASDFDRPDLERRRVHRQMHLAPHAALGPAMLARVPFALAPDLDPGTVDQQAQRAARAAVGQLHSQRLLPPAERREVRHRPIKTCQLHQARHEARRLTERQAEEHLHRQAGLDHSVAVGRLRAALGRGGRLPRRRRIEPDGQRAASKQRGVVAGPVEGAVAGGRRLRHDAQLCRWTHDVNRETGFVQQLLQTWQKD